MTIMNMVGGAGESDIFFDMKAINTYIGYYTMHYNRSLSGSHSYYTYSTKGVIGASGDSNGFKDFKSVIYEFSKSSSSTGTYYQLSESGSTINYGLITHAKEIDYSTISSMLINAGYDIGVELNLTYGVTLTAFNASNAWTNNAFTLKFKLIENGLKYVSTVSQTYPSVPTYADMLEAIGYITKIEIIE